MEEKKSDTGRVNNQLLLELYVYFCVVVILIVLSTAFQRTEGGVLVDEVYLRQSAVQIEED